ncbi:hypothetical protein [Persephonella sp. IF05-L8]|uniref:hypothetical protein n=1 Tax=Persephonella sp. IF05-L8 TaxID=1158338 RepID=UPI00049529AB
MEVGNVSGVSTYKDALELQKKLVEMLLQQNLQQNMASQPQNEEATKSSRQNIIEGTKVSIYV